MENSLEILKRNLSRRHSGLDPESGKQYREEGAKGISLSASEIYGFPSQQHDPAVFPGFRVKPGMTVGDTIAEGSGSFVGGR